MKIQSIGSKAVGILALIVCLVLCTGVSMLTGCASQESPTDTSRPLVRIGTMPTEDILPMWVAEQENLFEGYGIDAEVISFDSAQSLSAAITAGEVDMAMTDIMRAVKLTESGADVCIEWITLGVEPEQGRFGVMANADAPYSTLEEMAAYAATGDGSEKYAVGVASNTVPEYVFDMLCEQQGIADGSIPTVEVASLPDRYSLMATGKIGAAALPASLLELGQQSGMKLLADDTQGENVSQSVMVARASFADEHPDEVLAIAKAWDTAVRLIDEVEDSYLPLLVEKANINSNIAQTYPINNYPKALEGDEILHPSSELVDPQIEWMVEKGYGGQSATYDASTGKISKS